jgi:holo-[acyl-carrier protein] synthase
LRGNKIPEATPPGGAYYTLRAAGFVEGAMIVGLGIDLLEVAAMRRALEGHGERFADRVFTESEIADCRNRVDRPQALGARFAAKEACLKALGTGWSQGLGFQQVELLRAEGGKPEIVLHGAALERARTLGVRAIHVSLTHQRSMVAAVVVLED